MNGKLLFISLLLVVLGLPFVAATDSPHMGTSFDDAHLSGSDPTDESGNGYTLTNINTVTTGSTGILNEAFTFVRANDERVETDYTDIGSAGTISTWFYKDSNGGDQNIVALTVVGNDKLRMESRGSGNFRCIIDNEELDNGTVSIVEDQWYHGVLRWNSSSTWDCWLDGNKTGVGSSSKDPSNSIPISIGVGDYNFGTYFDYFDGRIDEFLVYDYALSDDEIADLYNAGSGCDPFDSSCSGPPSAPSNSSSESTAVVKQTTPISFTGGTAVVLASEFNVTVDETPLYGGYSFNVLSTVNNQITCDLFIDSVSAATVVRDNSAGVLGSIFFQTDVFNVSNSTSHTQSLECYRSSGGGSIQVSEAVGVGHFLVDESDNFIPYNSSSDVVAVTSGINYTLLDSFNITVGNSSIDGNKTNFIILEGSLLYTNNAGSSEYLRTYASIGGTNCSIYSRTVDAGSSGSGSIDCILNNVTSNSTYEIDFYGAGSNAEYDFSITAKSFYLDSNEIQGGEGLLVGSSFAGAGTPVKLFNVTGGNINHASANVFMKSGFSVNTSVDADVDFYIELVDGINFTSKNFSRSFSAGEVGVLTGHDVFEGVAQDVYEIELWGTCSVGTCTIVGGTTLGYVTDVTTTLFNSFIVTAYDIFDNSSLLVFNVTDGATYEVTNGSVEFFSTSATENLTFEASGYQTEIVLNHDTSLDLNQSLTPLYYFGTLVYSNYTESVGVNYTAALGYSLSALCPIGESHDADIVIDGVVFGTVALTCNDNLVPNTGTVIYSFDGPFDQFINWTGDASVTSTQSFTWDFVRPTIVQSFTTGTGFNNNSIDVIVTCTDATSPLIDYNVTWVDTVKNTSTLASGTNVIFSETAGTDNYVYTECTDLVGNVRTNNFSKDVFSSTFLLVDEQTGEVFDVDNLTSVVVYIDDNSSSLDLKGTGANNFSFTSTGDDILRFEYIYSDGFIINRYFDMSLTQSNSTRFCAIPDGALQFYEHIIVSAIVSTQVSLEASFADCVVLSDTTRFAYQNAFSIRTFTIDTTYILYNYLSGNVRSILASIDGGIESSINVDSLVFSSDAFNQGLRTESLNIQKISNTTMMILYNNTNSDNVEMSVVITRLDTGAVVYSEDEWDDINSFVLFYDFSTLVGLEDGTLFKIVLEAERVDGTSNTLNRFFNTDGKTGSMNPKIAFLFVFLMLIFGITFPIASDAFAWFGLLLTIGNLGIIASSVLTDALGFLLAINGVVMIYIIIILINQTSQRVAT